MAIPLAPRRRRRQEDYGMPARIRLNTRAFRNYCSMAGLKTQEQIGEFLGIDASHISRILSGERSIGADFIAAVVDAFRNKGIDPADVFVTVFEIYQTGDDGKAA